MLFLYRTVIAFTEIAGDLPREINADKSPYIVKADIFVAAGKTVRIEAGTVFLFNNFTGLHVRGILTAKGTATRPIIFTSSQDRSFALDTLNPTPYDWNGIYIQKDGMGTVMKHFIVRYSVKGIVSETKFINLNSGIFSENGRSHCTIEGVEQEVTEGVPFSFTVSLKDATVDGVPVKILHDPLAVKRNGVRYSGLTLFFGGSVVGGLFGREYSRSDAAFTALSSRDTSNTLHHTNSDWISARDKRNFDRVMALTGALIAITGGVGFWWSFTF